MLPSIISHSKLHRVSSDSSFARNSFKAASQSANSHNNNHNEIVASLSERNASFSLMASVDMGLAPTPLGDKL